MERNGIEGNRRERNGYIPWNGVQRNGLTMNIKEYNGKKMNSKENGLKWNKVRQLQRNEKKEVII